MKLNRQGFLTLVKPDKKHPNHVGGKECCGKRAVANNNEKQKTG